MDAARKFAHWIAAIAIFMVCTEAAAADRSQKFQFLIQRGSLASVLEQVSHQAGYMQLGTQLNVTESNTDELGPFAGHVTIDEAMSALLDGTDLWFQWQDDSVIRVYLYTRQQTNWSTELVTAAVAAKSIRGLSAERFIDPGPCGDLLVGPRKSDGPMSGEDFWIELIKPYCPIVRKRVGDGTPGTIDRKTSAGQAEHDFTIDEMPRVLAINRISEQAGGLSIGYISSDTVEEKAIVGPIHGRMSVNEALRHAIRDSVLVVRWRADNVANVEPAYALVSYADMSKCLCNFGFPELWPLRSEHVTVIESRLPSIEADIPARTVSYERKTIEATGASSVADYLRHAPQLPYMRPRGSTLNGAQYAALHGLEAKDTLVLVNGVRADVSASDLMTSAFDLNTIPISAVERVEVSATSPSMVHGMDAIAGIINIILRDSVSDPRAEIRYGSASGGARERIGTVAAGTSSDRGKTAFFLDYFDTTILLGAERERWRDMNYTRFGGEDRRSRFASPPNVYTLDGQDLPGLHAPEAAVSILPSGEVAFRAGETNLTSSLAMQTIAPAMRRASLTGTGQIKLGRSTLSTEGIIVHRHAHFQHDADIVPGFTMDASHPENPFHVPIAVNAALVGLPPRSTDSRSELRRGVMRLHGPIGAWRYHSFARLSQEEASATRVNFVDPVAVMNGLASTDGSALRVITDRPGELGSASILVSPQTLSTESGGTHISARTDGLLPFFRADATFGAEYRTERARLDARFGRLQRAFGAQSRRIADLGAGDGIHPPLRESR